MTVQMAMDLTGSPQTATATANVLAQGGKPKRAFTPVHRSQDGASEADDPTRIPRPLAVGSNRCLCGACGRHFGGPTTFDRHQTLTDAGDAVCHDPATRGLVVTWKGGHAWWSAPARFGGGDE